MSASCFEDLPNEIIRQVFSYLSPQDLMEGWTRMNDRLNELMFSLYHNVSFVGSNVTTETLADAYVLREQVISLVVTQTWCSMIKYFQNLHALKIIGLAPQFSISQLSSDMLPHLKRVEYFFENFHWNEFMGRNDCHYARQIVRCYVRRLNECPTVYCPTLRSICIELCSSEWLAALLRLAPNLSNIDVGLDTNISLDFTNLRIIGIRPSTTSDEHLSFTPTSTSHFNNILHNQLRRIKLRFDCNTTLKWLDSFLHCTPNITHFSLCIMRSYEIFSFEEFHRIITQRIPNLHLEKFHFQYSCLQKSFDLEQHRSIGPLFKNMIVEIETYQQYRLSLLTISINWENNEHDDIYNDIDFEDDLFLDYDLDENKNETEDT